MPARSLGDLILGVSVVQITVLLASKVSVRCDQLEECDSQAANVDYKIGRKWSKDKKDEENSVQKP
jgi:hypothetical protein